MFLVDAAENGAQKRNPAAGREAIPARPEVWHLRQGHMIRQAEGPRPRTLPGPEAWYWLNVWRLAWTLRIDCIGVCVVRVDSSTRSLDATENGPSQISITSRPKSTNAKDAEHYAYCA